MRRTHSVVAVVLLLAAGCAQAAGWDEQFNGRQPQQFQLAPIDPSRKGLAIYAIDRLEMLPKPIHRMLILREDEDGRPVATMSYNINRNRASVVFRMAF